MTALPGIWASMLPPCTRRLIANSIGDADARWLVGGRPLLLPGAHTPPEDFAGVAHRGPIPAEGGATRPGLSPPEDRQLPRRIGGRSGTRASCIGTVAGGQTAATRAPVARMLPVPKK